MSDTTLRALAPPRVAFSNPTIAKTAQVLFESHFFQVKSYGRHSIELRNELLSF